MKLKLTTLAKLYIALAFTLGFLEKNFPLPIFAILDDLLFLIIIFLGFIARREIAFDKPAALCFLVPAVLVFGCVVAFANDNSPVVTVLTLRQYKNFFLCFLFFFFGRDVVKFLLKIIVIVLLASIPLSIYQFFTVSHWDDITGFLGNNASGTLALLIVFYVASQFLIRAKNGVSVFGLYLLLLVPVFLNETKITFLLLPLVIVSGLVISGSLSVGKAFGIGLIGFLMVGLIDGLYETLYGISYFDFFQRDRFDTYMYGAEFGTDIGRFARIILAIEYLNSEGVLDLLFGKGAGASFHGGLTGLQGVASQALAETGLNSGSRIQMYFLLIDFGIVGATMIVSLIAFVLFRVSSRRLQDTSDIYLFCISIVVLAGMIYQPVLYGRELSLIYSILLFQGVGRGPPLAG